MKQHTAPKRQPENERNQFQQNPIPHPTHSPFSRVAPRTTPRAQPFALCITIDAA